MAKPIPREIIPNINSLKKTPSENPGFFVVSVMFFQGRKRDFDSAETEKKYGKKIKIFDTASRKLEKCDFM
ncbi:MAG: hypothetical protein US54_C0040G0003 [Candidatus Roizmanbacteria bacterium GW2011_GWA2_37_7]|uniref:Uncharacterized protein n=1 Tax=Candidatus Roizmanbacteria bacterium GW2011_GWA2_37_7 TaxID=1618481 RepID=A0A0G0H510_9BACT|nr:MAG: hypothetical protein US54_C0040G0003 [Candidatus Roizmanbacteria bacterium GW2011_GWA2_37_7]